MSDQQLREFERTYAESGTDEDLVALLAVLARREPLPCPRCDRDIVGSLLGDRRVCSWCGTVWAPKPASTHLAYVRMRIAAAAKLAEGLSTQGTQTGRLNTSQPHYSNLPRTIPPSVGGASHSGFGSEIPRLLAGDGIRFEDSPDGTVIHSTQHPMDPHINGPGPEDPRPRCEIITCAEPTWVSPNGAGALNMCLGHAIEERDRNGIAIPDGIRLEWTLASNSRSESISPRESYPDWMGRMGPLSVACPECHNGPGEFCHATRTGRAQFHLQREAVHRRLLALAPLTPPAPGPDFDAAHWPPEPMRPDVFGGRPPRYPDDLR